MSDEGALKPLQGGLEKEVAKLGKFCFQKNLGQINCTPSQLVSLLQEFSCQVFGVPNSRAEVIRSTSHRRVFSFEHEDEEDEAAGGAELRCRTSTAAPRGYES